MKIKELRKSIEEITTSWDSPEQRIDKLLNLFTKTTLRTIGEDEEIRADLDFIVANTRQIRNQLRQEMRSKLK